MTNQKKNPTQAATRVRRRGKPTERSISQMERRCNRHV